MTRCPNCARKVHFWHNHGGYCSKECRTASITSCPNCGRVGLYKHARLGCCSEDCRYWYVAGLLGYDKDALLTPAWDKIVYHVRLPSTSAEISSLQLDELEYDRASDTVLVIAAPPWMTRSRVLAELPYDRFDNAAWQHLWADGTLTEEELFRFHRLCYEDDLLCQKVGEHVFARLRQQPAPVANGLAPMPMSMPAPVTGYLNAAPVASPQLTPTRPMNLPVGLPQVSLSQARLPQARLDVSSLPPSQFVDTVRTLFEQRGYTVTPGAADNTFLLQRHGRTSLVSYQYHVGMVDVDPVQRAFAVGVAAGATQVFMVTNGHFTLQAEDFATGHPVQLIDGDELAELVEHRRAMPTVSEHEAAREASPEPVRASSNGASPHGEYNGAYAATAEQERDGDTEDSGDYASSAEHTDVMTPVELRPEEMRAGSGGLHFGKGIPPVDAEIIGGEGAV